MQDNTRDDPFSSEFDALDMIDSGFYEHGGEYEDPEDVDEIESEMDEPDDEDDDSEE